MERELWPRLYHLIMEVGQTFRLIDVSFQPHIIVLGTDQGFSSSNEHLESNTTRVFFIVSFPRIDSKPSPYLSRSSKTRCDSRSP